MLREQLHRIRRHPFLIGALLVLLFSLAGSALLYRDAISRYEAQLSVIVYDRHGVPLSIRENTKHQYLEPIDSLPEDFKALLIRKEDRFFPYHPGINPFSTLRAMRTYVTDGYAGGASTITQQLAKNLLGTEFDRTLPNKLIEGAYALSLELFLSKESILTMYANTVSLGNQVQGFETAARAYFDTSLQETTPSEQLALLATLSRPSSRNPWEAENTEYASALSARIAPGVTFLAPETTDGYTFQHDAFFELRTAGINCNMTCYSTIDAALTEKLREVLGRHIERESRRGARNGAIVVIDPRREEVLALIGSKDPGSRVAGNQINMALAPRPIGSTVKPFIYLKGFMEGLRPYTLVEDREYKYPIATGYSLYPKNYDGQYRGEVTLHEALSNSLNVPSVKVLEYITLGDFYGFLDQDLRFTPLQEYDAYQYGIALGGLEMDLLTLSHYFTLFPRGGTLAPLSLIQGSSTPDLPPQADISEPLTVANETYVSLVHSIISDRLTGVNQFGLRSNLNINAVDYGVKTGTSRDFHDSWVVGYTPDLVVGVWLGNVENEPLEQLSGQSGAGAVWHDAMQLLLATEYDSGRELPRTGLTRIPIDGSEEWGLLDDEVAIHRTLLHQDTLITSPFPGDSFEYFSGMAIPLRARQPVAWYINGETVGDGKAYTFSPERPGTYELMAINAQSGEREIVTISVTHE